MENSTTIVLVFVIGTVTGFLINSNLQKVTVSYYLIAPSQEIAKSVCENSFKINGNSPQGITITKTDALNEYLCKFGEN